MHGTLSRAQVQPAMARDLFPAGFVSCWAELEEGMQEALVRSLEAALASPSIPKDIVTTLLNLAEFMEHDEKSLPLDTRCCHLSQGLNGAYGFSSAQLGLAWGNPCYSGPNTASHLLACVFILCGRSWTYKDKVCIHSRTVHAS